MKLKICGVQSVDEALALADLGVDFIGLNFVPTSSRRVSFETGKAITIRLKSQTAQIVALFQNQPLELVQHYTQEIGPDYIQLHGDEPDEYVAELKTPVIKNVAENQEAIPTLAKYYLLDRKVRGQGAPIALKLAAKIIDKYPGQVFLAGGLTPENLPDIVTQVKPFAIDIAGGVRTDNRLDFEKVKRVLKIVRSGGV